MCFSCAKRITEKKGVVTFSQDSLVQRALKELNLNESNTDYIVSKVFPSNNTETIIVIPEVVKEEEWSSELNTNIIVANNTTGKITHKYFESSKTNGWVSDAIFIEDISIDTISYQLNTSKKAFGVLVKFRNMSQPNPYNQETISLFTKEKGSLKKVLDTDTIYENIGEVNVNTCFADFKIMKNRLSIGNTKTNGYFDIVVNKTMIQRSFSEDENGECNPTEKVIATEEKVLKFNEKEYVEKLP